MAGLDSFIETFVNIKGGKEVKNVQILINIVIDKIKSTPEICNIFAATANPLEVIIVETNLGRGIIGVVDGFKSKGIEKEDDIQKRKIFLRNIGYKL